jgi:hypothetical protein
MTAKLAYEIIMTLPETERFILFEMLEPEMKPFDLDAILEDNRSNLNKKEEMINYLIRTVFSKNKNS